MRAHTHLSQAPNVKRSLVFSAMSNRERRQAFEMFKFPTSLPGDEQRTLFSKLLSFTFVRHPFTRLVTAYQHKVLKNNYQGWRDKIPQDTNIGPEETEPMEKRPPTFAEFVRFIVGNERVLMPIFDKCSLCDVDYDVIGKVETAEEDTR